MKTELGSRYTVILERLDHGSQLFWCPKEHLAYLTPEVDIYIDRYTVDDLFAYGLIDLASQQRESPCRFYLTHKGRELLYDVKSRELLRDMKTEQNKGTPKTEKRCYKMTLLPRT